MKKQYKIKPKYMSVVSSTDYEKDFFKWTEKQIKCLKNGELEKLDIENLIEEIESLGNSNINAIENFLVRIICHKLKQKIQPEMNCKSWESSILDSQLKIKRILKNNPSLKRRIPEMLKEAYGDGLKLAQMETEKSSSKFPKECPWSIEEVLN